MSRQHHKSGSNRGSPPPKETNMSQAGGDTTVKGNLEEYARMMRKLINNKDFSDVKFIIGPKQKHIFAHRCILSARCAVFRAMFAEKSNPGEKDIPFVLSDMSPDIFLAMLEFIYTNCVTLSSKIAIDVLATSLEYGIDDLRDLCVEFLAANLTGTNACDLMQAAVTYNQNDLKEKAMVFIENNTSDVLRSKSFQEISEDTLVSILRSSRLMMDEIDLIKAVKDWATVNSVVNGRKVHEIARDAVKQLRLPLLSPEELEVLEEESKKDRFIADGSFAHAWKLHARKQADKENIMYIRRRGTNPREHHKYLSDQTSK
ncbi:BTB/POZ domain-containing protein 19-like [Elysia marginata]|uniref:BTB/POZ domain-containing protein 19-like n=1 Tax=Elysia marginata TaxID=1093978 RepID=A0AAV4HRE5_9GAST|nr:BTB/POZ domain-containing protein 19-like [Elysia marginata]